MVDNEAMTDRVRWICLDRKFTTFHQSEIRELLWRKILFRTFVSDHVGKIIEFENFFSAMNGKTNRSKKDETLDDIDQVILKMQLDQINSFRSINQLKKIISIFTK